MRSHGRERRSLFESAGFDEVFEYACAYRNGRPSLFTWLLNEPPAESGFGYSERHLQCLWYDNRYRPDVLRSSEGDIRIIHPGEWNTGPGPDFLNARMIKLPGGSPLRGDVEIHIRPRDWIAHGHQGDPAYDGVVVHVTWFAGDLPPSVMPSEVLTICLQEDHKELLVNADCMDISAYPAGIDVSHDLRSILECLSVDEASLLMFAAGQERLRRKTVRLQNQIDTAGCSEALYQELMAALGYRIHSACFRSIARMLPLSRLRQLAEEDTTKAYALLMGVGGLLPRRMESDWDPDTINFVRTLWDYWWPHAEEFETCQLPVTAWARGPSRPQNRPERRLLAAADLFTQPEEIQNKLHHPEACDSEDWSRRLRKSLTLSADLPYWGRRLAWGGKESERGMSLLGRGRMHAIIQNIAAPYAAGKNLEIEVWRSFLQDLPSEDGNSLVRKMALLLLGRDHNEAEYADGMRKQGLIQLYQDTILADDPEAATREIVEWIKNFSK